MACSSGSDDITSTVKPVSGTELPNADGSNDNPSASPAISVLNWESVLREVVALINAEMMLKRHDAIRGQFISVAEVLINEIEPRGLDTAADSLLSLGLTPQPLRDPDNRFLVDYSCSSGGTLIMALSPGTYQYQMTTDDCAINGDVYDGGFSNYGTGRDRLFSSIDEMTVQMANGTSFFISGLYETAFDRSGIGRSYEWTNASTTDTTDSGEYTVSSFTLTNESTHGNLEEFVHQASVTGGFDVTAEWTNNVPLNVTVSLALNTENPISELEPNTQLPSQWTTGQILIAAAEGSQLLTLGPDPADINRATVSLSGISTLFSILWSEGYQVRCFANAENFPVCQ